METRKMMPTKNAAAVAPSCEWYGRIGRIPPTPHLLVAPLRVNALRYQRNHTSLKSAINGLQFRRWQYESIFIRLAVIASETRKMSRNSKRIWPHSSSRSSKVINLGVNGKPICDFLLVINCNFSRICYRFRDIHA